MSAELAIEAKGLARAFGETCALDGVDLAIEQGSVFGLLGPNGAGKTTTVRILNGVLRPSAAETLRVLGHAIPDALSAIRPRVGVQTDTNLYERLTARDNLRYFARFYGMSAPDGAARVERLLERFGLADRAGERVGAFSKGMRQKLLIARALISDPELVYLDEPTAGLDPEASYDLMTYIRELSRDERRTFFITSHRLEEMEALCSQVAVLTRGRIVAHGSPARVAREAIPDISVRLTPARPGTVDSKLLAALPGVRGVAADDGGFVLSVESHDAVPQVVRSAAALDVDLLGVGEEPPTLEAAYLRLVHDSDRAETASESEPR